MQSVFDLISEGDLWSLLALIAILCVVGQFVIKNDLRYGKWATRLAVGAFLIYCTYCAAIGHALHAETLVHIAIRGLIAAGLTLGLSWITVPLVGFILEKVLSSTARFRALISQRSHHRKLRRQQRIDEATHSQQELQDDVVHFETEEQKRIADQNRASDQKRREMARLECQLLYDRYAKELSDRLPRDRIDEYFAAYMTDSHSPEAVEERAALLKRMIEESLESHLERRKPFASLQEIAQSFNEQREQIASLPYDEETKESMLAALEDGEQDAIREFLRP